MKNSKRIMSGFILFALAIIGVTAQAQRRPARVTDRQVSSILQRLERSTNTFRNSLNLALVNQRVDQTRPQNDINTFEPDLGTRNRSIQESVRHSPGRRRPMFRTFCKRHRSSMVS